MEHEKRKQKYLDKLKKASTKRLKNDIGILVSLIRVWSWFAYFIGLTPIQWIYFTTYLQRKFQNLQHNTLAAIDDLVKGGAMWSWPPFFKSSIVAKLKYCVKIIVNKLQNISPGWESKVPSQFFLKKVIKITYLPTLYIILFIK